jgi:uncharacterized membrane protein (UPF0127 family)
VKGFPVAIALAVAACSPQAAPGEAQAAQVNVPPVGLPQTGLHKVPLTITSANGVHRFTVDVAATPDQQETGLMFVKKLGPDRGMIFPYDPPQDVSFWMHNTLIPLDMVFIRADGTIARIATAKALDDTPVPSGEAIAAVLEIAAGRAAELGIRPGDRVAWPR